MITLSLEEIIAWQWGHVLQLHSGWRGMSSLMESLKTGCFSWGGKIVDILELLKKKGTEPPSRSCSHSCVRNLFADYVDLDWRRFNRWGGSRALCARTGECNSYGYHMQSSKVTCKVLKSLGLVVDIKNSFRVKWKRTERLWFFRKQWNRGKKKVSSGKKVDIILALSLGKVWILVSLPNILFVHRTLPW